jgi:phytoene dehydrogenase-like protein
MAKSGRSAVIIGAGIGGLATGCYLAANGYRTTIVEQATTPGGVCTSWTRNGYTFDGCIHNLAGSSPLSPLHGLLRELGVVPAVAMYAYPELVRVERADGPPLVVHADLEALEEHLEELAPADAAPIAQLISGAYAFRKLDLLALAVAPRRQRLAALMRIAPFARWGGTTLERFAASFTDPFLRQAIPTLVYDWPRQTVTMLMYFLARLHEGDLGWPMGGSLTFARAIERRFNELGGRVAYETRADSILVKDDRAVGIRLTDGTELRAHSVISNGYGPATIFEMLGGRYASRAIRRYYARPQDRVEMGIHVSLGVARDLSAEPHAIVMPLTKPTEIDGEIRERLYVEPFGFDPSLAPPGKAPLKVVMATSYARWEALARDPGRYAAAKSAVGEQVIAALEGRFPGLRRQTEVIDVATPVTTLRHTANGRGFVLPPTAMIRALLTGRRLSQTLPGLAGFHMVGQWAGIPGVPMVAAMGRDVARSICAEDGRVFETRIE